VTEIFFAIPLLLGGVLVLTSFPSGATTEFASVMKVVLALGILAWTGITRIMRSSVIQVKNADFVQAAMDMQADVMIERAERLLGTGIDCLYIGDPAASASLISPRHFERFCLPAYQKFCRHFQDQDTLIYIHICGNSRPILEMMADTGADVVEPLDPLGGVEVADAKRRIGGRVALMGGVNTLTLASGTPEDVRAEAIRKCREGGPYGYVLAAGDMVPPDTTLANLQALVDVATQSLWREGSG